MITSPTERFAYVEADPLLGSEARAILLNGTIRRFAPVRRAFAWTRNNRVPAILGQTNFFMEFDIRFCRSELFFEITPRGKVTFWARGRDKQRGNQSEPYTLTGAECTRRRSMHILPKGFVKTRCFGGFSCRNRQAYLSCCCELLRCDPAAS